MFELNADTFFEPKKNDSKIQNTDSFVFVYSKNGKIKVYNSRELKQPDVKLFLEQGWKHTDTLNTCAFIEYLADAEDKEKIKTINDLKDNG